MAQFSAFCSLKFQSFGLFTDILLKFVTRIYVIAVPFVDSFFFSFSFQVSVCLASLLDQLF